MSPVPWHVLKSKRCPSDKPWAVIKDATGEVVSCHETPQKAGGAIAIMERAEKGEKSVSGGGRGTVPGPSHTQLATQPDPEGRVDGDEPLYRALDRFYRHVARLVAGRLRDNAEPAPEPVLVAAAAGQPFGLPAGLELFSDAEWAALFDEIAADVVADQVVAGAADAAVAAQVSDEQLEAAIRGHVHALKAYSPDVRLAVSNTVAGAMRDRLTLTETAAKLREVGPLSATAARSVARTEAIAAVNAGSVAAWQSEPTVRFKRWNARDDARTRPAHTAADGQTVPVDEPFLVGGTEAMYPGDGNLPIGLRVNCRCRPVPVDENGDELGSSLDDANQQQLRAVAGDLGVEGRSRMGADQLRDAIRDRRLAAVGQPADQLSLLQLMVRAGRDAIKGRWRMARSDLIAALRRAARR